MAKQRETGMGTDEVTDSPDVGSQMPPAASEGDPTVRAEHNEEDTRRGSQTDAAPQPFAPQVAAQIQEQHEGEGDDEPRDGHMFVGDATGSRVEVPIGADGVNPVTVSNPNPRASLGRSPIVEAMAARAEQGNAADAAKEDASDTGPADDTGEAK